jgi:PTS hybrid protein
LVEGPQGPATQAREIFVVGIVIVSHSAELARGLADLARQMAGPELSIEVAGGGPGGTLGTDDGLVRDAIRHADTGDGVVVLCDLGSSILTVRHVLERQSNRTAVLADAPLVEGTVAAAVVASVGVPVEDVLNAAEAARGASKL